MRNRFWIIILLTVWLGQWQVGSVEIAPRPSVSEEGVWTSGENLAALVEHQAHQRLSRSPQRSRSRSQHQRRGVARYRRAHVVTDEATDEEQAPKSQAVFEPQRWGLSSELSQELPERLKGFCQR